VTIDPHHGTSRGIDAAPCRRRVVAVVGVGRSGTSALTRGIAALGVDLGDRLRPGRPKNPTGFFEDEDVHDLTQRLKRALDVRGASVRLLDAAAWRDPAVAALRAQAVETLRARFGALALWGFKHGRTLRLLPFWLEVFDELGVEPSYVVAIRNPLSVARSRGRLDPRRGVQAKSDLEWLVTTVPHFRHLRERPFAVVDYDLLLADPARQLRRVAAALGLSLAAPIGVAIDRFATDFVTPTLRHSHFGEDDLARAPNVNPLVRDAYGWLYGLATDRIDQRAPELWRDWERIDAALTVMAPVLDYVDGLGEEVQRTRTGVLGPLKGRFDAWRRRRR
jgi:hypothetical protein